MKKDKLDCIGYIDNELIEKAENYTVKKNNNSWIKWSALAAGLVASIAVAFLIFAANKPKQAPKGDSQNHYTVSVGGVMREYSGQSIYSESMAIVWPWEYKTMYEKFTTIDVEGRVYSIKATQPVSDSCLGEKMGAYEATGYDEFDAASNFPGKKYNQKFDVWSIEGVSKDLMVAVEMEGKYYVFQYDTYVAPKSLGEVLDNYNLAQKLELTYFTEYKASEENGSFKLSDNEGLWQLIEVSRDAQFVEDEPLKDIQTNRICFAITAESLGVQNLAFEISEDGYISTNAFSWRYKFFVGEKAANELITFAKNNSTEAKPEPNQYSLTGTITEVGDDYILIDDSALCANEKDGLTFKVMTTDARIKRHIDYEKIGVGAMVIVQFTDPVDVSAGNVINSAVSMDKGMLQDGGIYILE